MTKLNDSLKRLYKSGKVKKTKLNKMKTKGVLTDNDIGEITKKEV
jgi:hypothetical protein